MSRAAGSWWLLSQPRGQCSLPPTSHCSPTHCSPTLVIPINCSVPIAAQYRIEENFNTNETLEVGGMWQQKRENMTRNMFRTKVRKLAYLFLGEICPFFEKSGHIWEVYCQIGLILYTISNPPRNIGMVRPPFPLLGNARTLRVVWCLHILHCTLFPYITRILIHKRGTCALDGDKRKNEQTRWL